MLKNNIEFQDYIPKLFPDLYDPTQSKDDCVVKTFTFQVTDSCSLNCSYCYQINKCNNFMTFETAKKMIDKLLADRNDINSMFCQSRTKGIVVEFIGGEPFLAIDLITQICDYFESELLKLPDCPWLIYHRYNFSSNGVAYFEPKVQSFLRKYESLTSVNVTIDGCKELHDKCRVFPNGTGSYDIAIKAALDQLNHGYSGTKITVSPENVGYVFEGIQNMIQLGFRFININCVFEEGWTIIHARQLYQELVKTADWLKENNLQDSCYIAFFDLAKYTRKEEDFDRNWCGVVGNMLSMDYRGDIYPCIRFMESSLGTEIPAYKIGNVETGIGSAPIEKQRIENLSGLTKTIQSTSECLNCPIESGCAWCSGYNYQKYGTIERRATFICIMHKAAALGALYFYTILDDSESLSQIKINKTQALEIISQEEWNYLRGEEE